MRSVVILSLGGLSCVHGSTVIESVRLVVNYMRMISLPEAEIG